MFLSPSIKGKFFNGDDPLQKSALLPRSSSLASLSSVALSASLLSLLSSLCLCLTCE